MEQKFGNSSSWDYIILEMVQMFLTFTEFNQIADEGEKSYKNHKNRFPRNWHRRRPSLCPLAPLLLYEPNQFQLENPRGYAYRKGKINRQSKHSTTQQRYFTDRFLRSKPPQLKFVLKINVLIQYLRNANLGTRTRAHQIRQEKQVFGQRLGRCNASKSDEQLKC